MPWSLLDEKQSGEFASLELPDHSLEFGRRMSWLWSARRAFGFVTGELFLRKVKKKQNRRGQHLLPNRWYAPAIVVGKERNNVFVFYRGRATKVALECLRKASVAANELGHHDEGESPFETAPDEENLSWEEPLLVESGEFHESEKPDTMARPQKMEEEVNSPMNDDVDLLFSEPVAEKDDHSEEETQVEAPDPVTEEPPNVVRELLRLPQRRLRSKQPPPVKPEEAVESKSKKGHASMCQSCCTMHFSQKLLDPKRSNGMA